MGGGPSAWAVEAHARAGLPVYATEDAARTLNDELSKVEALGIRIVSENEAAHLPSDVTRVEFRDFRFHRDRFHVCRLWCVSARSGCNRSRSF